MEKVFGLKIMAYIMCSNWDFPLLAVRDEIFVYMSNVLKIVCHTNSIKKGVIKTPVYRPTNVS